MWSRHVKRAKNVKNERSFKKMNIDFAKTFKFLEWATFLEHSRRNFADQMITGWAISPNLCTMTFGTPCTLYSVNTIKKLISALASAQGLITHTTSRRDSQRHIYENSVSPCETVRTTRCFFREDNSAISLLIELKLSGMVDFTIADVRYYVPCLFFIGITLKYRKTTLIPKNLSDQKFERAPRPNFLLTKFMA